MWYFRLKFEASKHLCASFVTLTYDDDHLPFNVNEETGEMVNTVKKEDIQSFFHDVRKKIQCRYMVTSEYGPKTLRPHYHGVIYHDQPFDFLPLWKFGENNVQYPAKPGSYKYILKYILKGSKIPDGADENFRLMSLRPGIGAGFQYKGSEYLLTEDGVKCAVPRYYRRNYENSLNAKLRDVLSDVKLDYLAQVDQHAVLHDQYDFLLKDGSISPDYDFETWLSDQYKEDFIKQVKINLNRNE